MMNKNLSRIALLSLAGSLLLSSPVPGGALDAKAAKDRITDAVANTGWTNGPVASVKPPVVEQTQSAASSRPAVVGKVNLSLSQKLQILAEAACTAPLSNDTAGAYFLKYLVGEQALGKPLKWSTVDSFSLGITPDQCSADGKLLGEDPHPFFLAHVLNAEKGKAESYFYLASAPSKIIKADHVSDHAATVDTLVSTDDPIVVADFKETVDSGIEVVRKYLPKLLEAPAQPAATSPSATAIVKN